MRSRLLGAQARIGAHQQLRELFFGCTIVAQDRSKVCREETCRDTDNTRILQRKDRVRATYSRANQNQQYRSGQPAASPRRPLLY